MKNLKLLAFVLLTSALITTNVSSQTIADFSPDCSDISNCSEIEQRVSDLDSKAEAEDRVKEIVKEVKDLEKMQASSQNPSTLFNIFNDLQSYWYELGLIGKTFFGAASLNALNELTEDKAKDTIPPIT
jgi:hypothetical protein